MSIFEGIWVPLVTPFHHGEIDFDKAQRLAILYRDAGVHGLVVCGTTGEAATLSEKEQEQLLMEILAAVGDTCPVLMGISGSDTRHLAEKVKRYEQANLRGFLVPAPPYVKPSQDGIFQHFNAIAQATERAVVIYNIPSRTGVNIDLNTVLRLKKHANVVAIKECGGSLNQLADLINLSDLKVLCGDDVLLFHSLCLGGHGAISAAAHIRPDLFVHLYNLCRKGEIVVARTVFHQLLPMIQMLFSEPNPAPVKAALAMSGLILEEMRLPMVPMSRQGRAKLSEILLTLMSIPDVRSEQSIAALPGQNLFQPSFIRHAVEIAGV
jgi:4-hydroxy-tetrahydrodipicolinate synthase